MSWLDCPYVSFLDLRNKVAWIGVPQGQSAVEKKGSPAVVPVKLVEIAGGREAATAQAALGGSWGVSLAGAGMRISAMASTPM